MPGKLCVGDNQRVAVLRDSKAYCEGMHYRATGMQRDRPKSDNPHPPGSDAADAWDLGWQVAADKILQPLTAEDVGCCGLIGIVVPSL